MFLIYIHYECLYVFIMQIKEPVAVKLWAHEAFLLQYEVVDASTLATSGV
jgi:hypothetical protein